MDYIDHFTLLPGAAGRGTVDQYDSNIKGLAMNETASLGLTKALEGRKEFLSVLLDVQEWIYPDGSGLYPSSAVHCRMVTTATEQTGTQVTCFFPPKQEFV